MTLRSGYVLSFEYASTASHSKKLNWAPIASFTHCCHYCAEENEQHIHVPGQTPVTGFQCIQDLYKVVFILPSVAPES